MANILITGLPGVGKTTLVKKIVNHLRNHQIHCDGFYTEEVRVDGSRIGFDLVTLGGERGVLARKGCSEPGVKRLSVGQYNVHLQEFENLALPVFDKPKPILIVDEVGKMELFSRKFQELVKNVVNDNSVQVIATVPLRNNIPFVNTLKDNTNCQVILVTTTNRDYIINDVLNLINLSK